MVSKAKQASNKHKLVAERAGLVKHQMAIASAARDELKLRNRSLLECQQINQALNRQLSRERDAYNHDINRLTSMRNKEYNRAEENEAECYAERKWKRMYMLTATIFIVAEYSPKLYSYIAGLL